MSRSPPSPCRTRSPTRGDPVWEDGGGAGSVLLRCSQRPPRQGRSRSNEDEPNRFDLHGRGPVSFLRLPPSHLRRRSSGARLIFENSTVCLSMNWFVCKPRLSGLFWV